MIEIFLSESVIMANAPINSALIVDVIADPTVRRGVVKHIYQESRAMIGKEMADQLRFPPSGVLGVLAYFRRQSRYYRLLDGLFPNRPNPNSHFNNLTQFPGVFAFGDAGISYKMPDHVYDEQSRG